MGTSFENGISVSFWAFLKNNANIFYLKTGFPFYWACDGNLWKIMPISSIWKRNFRVFSGLVMGTSFENGISVFFLGLWWEPLENNINIFYLKTGFPLFFLACDSNLWKIISISSIWKRNFRVFSGLVMGTSFENGISVSFWAFLENNANIFYLKTGFPFFWACDGNLWKIMPISSIWKRDRSGTRPEVLLHSPLRGVTRVWASMFYWFYLKKIPAKNHKKLQWDKRFSNRRYCKHHPNVDGCKVQK